MNQAEPCRTVATETVAQGILAKTADLCLEVLESPGWDFDSGLGSEMDQIPMMTEENSETRQVEAIKPL